MVNKKILIADDDKDAVEFLQKGLEREGFQVCSAFDGLDAKAKIGTQKPDIIILDLIMPGLNGWQILEWLRNEEKNATPIIIVSAKDELDDMKKGYALKADTYLVKPIEINDVLAAINAVSTLSSEGA